MFWRRTNASAALRRWTLITTVTGCTTILALYDPSPALEPLSTNASVLERRAFLAKQQQARDDYYQTFHYHFTTLLLDNSFVRATRSLFCLATCILDYKTALHPYRLCDTQHWTETLDDVTFTAMTENQQIPIYESYRRAIEGAHSRSAQRLLNLCRQQGGIYIKIGQHLSALDILIPRIYCDTLSILQDAAPVSSKQEMNNVFYKETRFHLDDVFEQFDPVPLGCASLAQVHGAQLKKEKKWVAIKIQHAHLDQHAKQDMKMIDFAVHALDRLFPQFPLAWLSEEVKRNLPVELDFQQEAKQAEHCAQLLKSRYSSLVYIPEIRHEFSTRRILVMSFVNGMRITDSTSLKAAGVSVNAVVHRLQSVFVDLIFRHGFVHADPHPGNLMIQLKENATWWDRLFQRHWQLVLLDHGLYRSLSESFRLDYCRLWLALLSGNEAEVQRQSMALGGIEAHRLFACILTQRSWDAVHRNVLSQPRTKGEVSRVQRQASSYVTKITQLLSLVPRELLLLFKTNDLLRSVARSLLQKEDESYQLTYLGSVCVQQVSQYEKSPWIFVWSLWMQLKFKLIGLYLQFLSSQKPALETVPVTSSLPVFGIE